jgi:hypothetical protein
LARLDHVTLQNLPRHGSVEIAKIGTAAAVGRKSIIWQLTENTTDKRLGTSIFA